ncbi:MarR family winged helix-turn-helix transcriptional regulator [Nocardioides sp.]|uniref:MarR family winged helix-turn-helix transcriptional regulator n=1 Tax=Nocardioides sp. TaxID=35761 RepID=UPI003561869C
MTERDETALPQHLYRWLESVLLRVSREFDAVIDHEVARLGHRRLRIVQLIPPGGIRQQALAERALVTKQAIATLVDHLETDGLVLRTPDPEDGRAWLVRRTEAGDRISDAADRAMVEVEQRLARDVGATRYAEFRSALETIGQNPDTA